MIAVLYVDPKGVYADLPDVDVWDISRDARLYPGPWPVVAHPPCERWGRYWYGGPILHKQGKRRVKGDDGGCFAAALATVRQWGGVLEHPQDSWAWKWHHLICPPSGGGWVVADWCGGWTCCVEQGHYGHRARKGTWLYAHSVKLPLLRWGRSSATMKLDDGYYSAEERRRAVKLGTISRLPRRERAATPIPFRDLLLELARSVKVGTSLDK